MVRCCSVGNVPQMSAALLLEPPPQSKFRLQNLQLSPLHFYNKSFQIISLLVANIRIVRDAHNLVCFLFVGIVCSNTLVVNFSHLSYMKLLLPITLLRQPIATHLHLQQHYSQHARHLALTSINANFTILASISSSSCA